MRNKLSFSLFIDKYDRKQEKDSFKFANHSANAQKIIIKPPKSSTNSIYLFFMIF